MHRRPSSLACLALAALGSLLARPAPAATEYQCGAGKPNKSTKKCDCPPGKVESTDGKGVSRCIAAPKPPPPPPPPTAQPKPTPKPPPPAVAPKAIECPPGMAAIPGGTYTLGKKKNTVTVSPFCLDLTEVTVKAYGACVSSGSCSEPSAHNPNNANWKWQAMCNWKHPAGREKHPINCVDWNQAKDFCEFAGKRLPSEEEWEWAARGGPKAWTYSWGDEPPSAARLNACGSECPPNAKAKVGDAWKDTWTNMYGGDDGYPETAPVGSFPAGAYGLSDMSGNVWEWTSSNFDAESGKRVDRGGSWDDLDAAWVSASSRDDCAPSLRDPGIGLRCARTAP